MRVAALPGGKVPWASSNPGWTPISQLAVSCTETGGMQLVLYRFMRGSGQVAPQARAGVGRRRTRKRRQNTSSLERRRSSPTQGGRRVPIQVGRWAPFWQAAERRACTMKGATGRMRPD